MKYMKSFDKVIRKKRKLKDQCSLSCLPIGPLKINNKTYVGVTNYWSGPIIGVWVDAF